MRLNATVCQLIEISWTRSILIYLWKLYYINALKVILWMKAHCSWWVKMWEKFVAWDSMGNHRTSQHWLHTVPTTVNPLLGLIFQLNYPLFQNFSFCTQGKISAILELQFFLISLAHPWHTDQNYFVIKFVIGRMLRSCLLIQIFIDH